MPPHHSKSAAQALYQVFVLPNLCRQSTAPLSRISRRPSHFNGLPRTNNRHFSVSPASLGKPSKPEKRTEKWDNEITAKTIYLIDSETETLIPEPRTRYDVLNRLDRSTHRLVQFGAEHQGLPVCKIVNKKEAYEHEKRKKQDAKERKKVEAASKSLKTLELNWAMDPNDLGHKLDKMTEFLSEGRKVEVILASKKKGRKASSEDCEAVLQKIRKSVDAVDGAKEAKSLEGKVGGFATLTFQGKVPQQQASQASE